MKRWLVWLRCVLTGHEWRYFIDGFVGRSCRYCPKVQYDLPMVGSDNWIQSLNDDREGV